MRSEIYRFCRIGISLCILVTGIGLYYFGTGLLKNFAIERGAKVTRTGYMVSKDGSSKILYSVGFSEHLGGVAFLILERVSATDSEKPAGEAVWRGRSLQVCNQKFELDRNSILILAFEKDDLMAEYRLLDERLKASRDIYNATPEAIGTYVKCETLFVEAKQHAGREIGDAASIRE